ncbi:phosphatidylinositol N-acetylglucosaminyltransferase subunit P-like [Dendrobium catenatum]|uniref:phosphatidylinositol N-acetylglucosaminyltransferase subunit P-like n=1 Tax=Dendrobium catenatum TaxID=906689 RepID=UPI00109EE40A|nr:phosphatidylinositol N-acetylglucosaminyltransferase subunit P-like [Dendrobium catenatum]
MSSPPSSPTPLVVSSPRKTLSLLRERRSSTFSFDPEEKKSPAAVAGFAAEHGPKPSEVYGFVGSITTVIATVIYLVWAYTPEPWLHSLGITYYPSKIWALAVPTFVMVTVALVIAVYIGLNFMVTPPPTSFSTIFDEYSREPSPFVPIEGEEQPIEPISDLDISYVNDLMFGEASKL